MGSRSFAALRFEDPEEGGVMTPRISRVRILSILAATLAVFAALLASSAPAQADDDDKIIKVSSWCGYYVYFTNPSSHEVDVDYEIVVPLSPFSSKDGHFSLDPHETYKLQAYGGQKGGPVHRLYYYAESDDHDQEGYVDQWKHCAKKPLVKYSVHCGYATFTNVFNHKVKVKYQEGGDYGEWDDDFFFYPGQSKKIEFDSKVLWWSAESRWGDDHYRRLVGTIYQPKYCDEYEDYKKKHDDDDDDDDEFKLHDAGDFILKIIPFSDGPLIDKPFKKLFG
jgi:hypothetical protein